MTKPAMLDRLNEIRDGWIIAKRNRANRILEDMDADHTLLWDSVNMTLSIHNHVSAITMACYAIHHRNSFRLGASPPYIQISDILVHNLYNLLL